MEPIQWVWERTNPNVSGSSGDISKLFRHEQVKNPGIMAKGAPSASATLLAREVIQNSWDAARELQEEDENAPPFEIDFTFANLEDASQRDFITHLDLKGLADRAARISRDQVGLRSRDCLTTIGDGTPQVPLLYIEEHGTTGMYGRWSGASSKMYLALVSLGYTEKMRGAGGSYGYGKAGLIRGSAIRTIVAYTCFRQRDDDPGVTRRLLGMTYWGQHTLDGESFTGFARLGARDGDGVRPFENEQADELAELLGISVRTPTDPFQLGTTFLVVEPTVEPDDLVVAVNRSWWPAFEDGLFEVVVRSADGSVQAPRPRQDPVLRTFINAFQIATTPQDNEKKEQRRFPFRKIGEFTNPGTLGLVADPEGWSYAVEPVESADGEQTEQRSLVALMRSPRMVVEYLDVGRTPPYVRGAFVASDEVDELLRRTEPKGHDAWLTEADDGEIDEEAAKVAKDIRRRIRTNVNTFRNQIKPPVPPPEDVRLPHFDRLMRQVMRGRGLATPPLPDTRLLSIRVEYWPIVVDAGSIRVTGSVGFSLSEHYQGDAATVEISVQYKFIEDEHARTECPLDVEGPPGYESKDGVRYVGTIKRGDEVFLRFESESYPADWSGRLFANGEIVDDAGEGS